MDPITHAALGLAVSKATGNGVSITNPACLAVVAGSVFPDIDIVLQKWGDCVYLKNHRGISHSLPGLIISSLFISGVLGIIFPASNILSLFFWALAGCVSHVAFDIFNSYGTKILWPFWNKKFTFSLLMVFDPMVISFLLGYILLNGIYQRLSMGALLFYMLFRAYMRLAIGKELRKKFGKQCSSISILPSMTGVFRWHFILEDSEQNIVGEKNVLRRRIKIIKRLEKIQDSITESLINSPAGKFFREFTPLFHISCEQTGNNKRYVFIDLRYYARNKFLHHAVVEIDKEDSIVKETFNPYSINRENVLAAK